MDDMEAKRLGLEIVRDMEDGMEECGVPMRLDHARHILACVYGAIVAEFGDEGASRISDTSQRLCLIGERAARDLN